MPIYRAGILIWIDKKIHATCSKEWKPQNFFTKVEQLLKLQLENMPTVSVMSGNERENKTSSLYLISEHEPNNSMHLALASACFRLFDVKLWNRKQNNYYKFIKYLKQCCTCNYKFYTNLPLTLLSIFLFPENGRIPDKVIIVRVWED